LDKLQNKSRGEGNMRLLVAGSKANIIGGVRYMGKWTQKVMCEVENFKNIRCIKCGVKVELEPNDKELIPNKQYEIKFRCKCWE
jgi:hypothetical protein